MAMAAAPPSEFVHRLNGHAGSLPDDTILRTQFQAGLQLTAAQYLPGGRKSLQGISVRAFCLGIAFGVGSLSAVQLAYFGYGLWRMPFFMATLAMFHYLEFDMTARFNPSDARVSSFLLFNNGLAYTLAHTTAMLETGLRYWWTSEYRPGWLRMLFTWEIPDIFPATPSHYFVLLGLMLVVVGQATRSLAMAHAKTNFNHIVQSTKKMDHVLVKNGVYAFSRHPSYFGFFWWGLGTQLVLGNHVCFLVYTILLWNFFNRRITQEEEYLVDFFGQDYVKYREQVGVWIPFIR